MKGRINNWKIVSGSKEGKNNEKRQWLRIAYNCQSQWSFLEVPHCHTAAQHSKGVTKQHSSMATERSKCASNDR